MGGDGKGDSIIYHIASYFGGLGDSLQFSTLPEELTRLGHTVHLWSGAVFRNDEIRELVWGTNPFVHAPIEGDWNLGDIPATPYNNPCNDFIKNWEHAFGLTPRNSFPKVYRAPTIERGRIGLIDLTSITVPYNHLAVERAVQSIIALHPQVRFLTLRFQRPLHSSGLTTDMCIGESLPVRSLFQYHDLLCGCEVYVSLASGGHMLAGASRQHNPDLTQYCIIPQHWLDEISVSFKFKLPRVIYRAV